MEIVNHNLQDFLLQYDTFVIDLYRTVIDSSGEFINGVDETLELLVNKGKKVIICTNYPLCSQKCFAEPVWDKYKKLGIEFYTSGEICQGILKESGYNKYFLFGSRALDGFESVTPEEAEFIYLDLPALPKEYVSEGEGFSVEQFPDVIFTKRISLFRPFLEKLVGLGKIMYSGKPCINDYMEFGEVEVLSNLAVVDEYRRLGGEVIEIGKPYSQIYEKMIADKKSKVLCVGDTMETDVKGAFDLWMQGYDATSLLVLTGETKLFEVSNYTYKPDFVTPSLGKK